ncbi:MAG TPA: hypothetical protein VNF07_04670 [Acidimicrobiales bacterium]|nr:hypothetical protein [Acidimicrobiales bacterium]
MERRAGGTREEWTRDSSTGGTRAVAALLAAAAGSAAGAAGASAALPARRSAAPSAAVVAVLAKSRLGTILVTPAGGTLYRYALDRPGRGSPRCLGHDRAATPPAKGGTTARRGSGVGTLGTVRDPGGRLQVTWRGSPLYTYSGDRKAGATEAKVWPVAGRC